MENETSFDLNQHILDWRKNLGQSPAFRGENLDELEAHLRDSVALLQTRGLSAGEAFMVAAKRAGTIDSLAAEFGKVNRQAVWMDRIFWMLVGLQMWVTVHGFISGIARAASIFALTNWINPGERHARLVYIAAFIVVQSVSLAGSLGICWWLTMNKGPVFASWIIRLPLRSVTLIMALLLLGAFALENLSVAGMNMLFVKMVNNTNRMQLLTSQGYSSTWGFICQTITMLTFTIILARKRLALGKTT